MLEEDMLDGWRGCQVEEQNSVLFIISLVRKKILKRVHNKNQDLSSPICLCLYQWALNS